MNTRILASLMVIGVAAAVAGGSTFALFNDTEASEGNTFTTGAIDLKIDWNHSYNGVDLGDQPPTDNPMAIFNQSDVKPGDHGEATISFHIIDNDGWLWMRSNLTKDDDVSSNEPELEVDDPENPNDLFDGELAGVTQIRLWYDDGDNVYEDEPLIFDNNDTCQAVPLDVALAFDRSGSMDGPNAPGDPAPNPQKFQAAKDGAKILFAGLGLENNDQAALVSFNETATLDQQLTQNEGDLNNSVDALNAQGNTGIGDAINVSREELLNGANARAGAQKVLILLSNGNENVGAAEDEANLAKAQGIRVITIAYGADADQQALEDLASSPNDAYNGDQDDVNEVFQTIVDDSCVPGNLKNLDRTLGSGLLLDGEPTVNGTQPFNATVAHYIGFEWHIPVEVGNEVQTDSAMFDLEWFAEQSRNNENPQNPWQTPA